MKRTFFYVVIAIIVSAFLVAPYLGAFTGKTITVPAIPERVWELLDKLINTGE